MFTKLINVKHRKKVEENIKRKHKLKRAEHLF